MKFVRTLLVLVTLLLLAALVSAADKQIAITIDELPAAPSFEEIHPDAINYLILDALKKHHVKATGFVVGANIGNSLDILGQWLDAGHALGTMTYDNQDVNEVTADQFKAEVVKGVNELEGMLNSFGQTKRYFRFPFHKYGSTPEMKHDLRDFIQAHGEVICPATVIPEDFVYNATLAKLGKTPDSAHLLPLRDEYLNHIFDLLDRQEQLAEKLAARPVKQILLLRANRLNAIFIDDILTAFEDHGYKFIPLDSALTDDIYHKSENYTGSRGVGWLEMVAGKR